MAASGSDDQPYVVGLSCGSSHSVALLSCDVVASWGRGEDGQLGHGDAMEVKEPKAVFSLVGRKIKHVACGAEYTLAIADETVYSWGWGDFGRLGHGDGNDVFLPQPISYFSGQSVVQVACGDTHTLVATAQGALYSFGRNQNGQLGLGHNTDCLAPQLVTSLQGEVVTSVACGSEHSIVATAKGEVYAWGWGRYGNLGNGQCEDRYTPTKVSGLEGVAVAKVNCGWRHSIAVSKAGKVYTFGWSKYGQLGHGDMEDTLVPTPVRSLEGKVIAAVAGGWRHTMAADEDGVLYAWGWNKFGQLGLGDTEDRSVPTIVSKLAPFKIQMVACGWRHTLAVTRDGQVYSWGRGVNGQLGLGDEEDVYEPQPLKALSRGTLSSSGILSTSSAAMEGSYVAAADRFAVVPGNDAPMGLGGFDAMEAGAEDEGCVPTVPDNNGPAAKKRRPSQAA